MQDTGCREACSFHDWRGSSQPSPVVEARGEKTLTVDADTTTLRWPRPAGPPSQPRLVYVVMRRREPGTRRTWSQLGQTAGHELRLPKSAAAPSTVIRVLAVSVEGLTTIYSPPDPSSDRRGPVVSTTTPTTTTTTTTDAASVRPGGSSSKSAAGPSVQELRDADIIIRSLGRDQILGIRLPLAARSEPQEESLRLMVSKKFCLPILINFHRCFSDNPSVWNLLLLLLHLLNKSNIRRFLRCTHHTCRWWYFTVGKKIQWQ